MRSQAAPLLPNFHDDRTSKLCLVEKNVILGGFVDFVITNIILPIAIATNNEGVFYIILRMEEFQNGVC